LSAAGPWAGQAQWRVLQTAFGSGSDFLALWRAWRDDPQRPRMLHVAAIAATCPSPDALPPELAAQWSEPGLGFHRFVFEQGHVLLTLCVGELNSVLREQQFTADAVLLDGAPPLQALKSVARICRRGAVLSAPVVTARLRKDLVQCGFAVDEARIEFAPAWEPKGLRHGGASASDCVVVGGGLAGAAVAASLARRGWTVRMLDAAPEPAAGASGLPAGLIAPHYSPDDSLLSRLTRAGIRATLQQARALLREGQDWQLTGVQEQRADTAPLWHPEAGWIKPAALVRAFLAQPGIRWQGSTQVAHLAQLPQGWQLLDAHGNELAQAPLVVIAAAHGSAALLGEALQLQPVRGQLSWAAREPGQEFAPHAVKGNGHFLPAVPVDGAQAWLCGSTFSRDETSLEVRSEDHEANLERLRALLPEAARQLEPVFAAGAVKAWTGVRCVSTDRRPLLGEAAPALWVSTAMGSRGLSFAVLCAELLAARLHGEPLPLPRKMAAALDISRLN
jgi:tRNA 5-methylaminomethyl-2-thiouridine biosynthesis bifunctional protein